MTYKKSNEVAAKERRKVALAALEAQLESKVKKNNPREVVDGKTITQQKKDVPFIPLTQKDITRIKKDVETLKSRI